MSDQPAPPLPKRRGRLHRGMSLGAKLLLFYLAVAYLLLPLLWETYERRHPWLDDSPRITKTGDGHPGDPLNVSLIGAKKELVDLLKSAGWRRADALGLESDLRIGADTILERPYADAPVSSLFLFGRAEDLAFEQPAADNPRRRHHVRLWNTGKTSSDGRPVWIGSASYDASVGFSRTTGQITHHIAADIDAERDYLAQCLEKTGRITDAELVPNFHTQTEGRNGGGDPWRTDGSLWIGTIKAPD